LNDLPGFAPGRLATMSSLVAPAHPACHLPAEDELLRRIEVLLEELDQAILAVQAERDIQTIRDTHAGHSR
jgi:hypothetical protein